MWCQSAFLVRPFRALAPIVEFLQRGSGPIPRDEGKNAAPRGCGRRRPGVRQSQNKISRSDRPKSLKRHHCCSSAKPIHIPTTSGIGSETGSDKDPIKLLFRIAATTTATVGYLPKGLQKPRSICFRHNCKRFEKLFIPKGLLLFRLWARKKPAHICPGFGMKPYFARRNFVGVSVPFRCFAISSRSDGRRQDKASFCPFVGICFKANAIFT